MWKTGVAAKRPPKEGRMIKWLLEMMTPEIKHFTEGEIRHIIERDLPTHHLKRRPTKKGGRNENSSDQG